MIKVKLIFFIFFLFSNPSLSLTISVINIDRLINENNEYKNILNEIDESQNNYLKTFKESEQQLDLLKKEIKDSELLLDEIEINNLINNYNTKLDNFTKLIEKFNLHYQDELIKIRQIIFEKIIMLIKEYSYTNNVDLVLDSTSYLMASNSIDITDKIYEELEKINFNLEFKKFEEN